MTPLDFFLYSLLIVLKWDQEHYPHVQSGSELCYQLLGAGGSALQSSFTQLCPFPSEELQLRKEQGLELRLRAKWLFYCTGNRDNRIWKTYSQVPAALSDWGTTFCLSSSLVKKKTLKVTFSINKAGRKLAWRDKLDRCVTFHMQTKQIAVFCEIKKKSSNYQLHNAKTLLYKWAGSQHQW